MRLQLTVSCNLISDRLGGINLHRPWRNFCNIAGSAARKGAALDQEPDFDEGHLHRPRGFQEFFRQHLGARGANFMALNFLWSAAGPMESPWTLAPRSFIWVNYHISLTWIVRPFGDDFPYLNPWFPGLGRTVRSWWNLPRFIAQLHAQGHMIRGICQARQFFGRHLRHLRIAGEG